MLARRRERERERDRDGNKRKRERGSSRLKDRRALSVNELEPKLERKSQKSC